MSKSLDSIVSPHEVHFYIFMIGVSYHSLEDTMHHLFYPHRCINKCCKVFCMLHQVNIQMEVWQVTEPLWKYLAYCWLVNPRWHYLNKIYNGLCIVYRVYELDTY